MPLRGRSSIVNGAKIESFLAPQSSVVGIGDALFLGIKKMTRVPDDDNSKDIYELRRSVCQA